MTKTIPAEALFEAWRKDPAYIREYEALENEFSLAASLIDARARADLTQQDVATRMHTSQQAVARLEGGHANPSVRTLQRFAEATGTRLRIVFDPKPDRG